MNREQLMNKVNKLLALAGNNPSQEEANRAMEKAQALIAEYNLNMDEFAEKDDIVFIPATHPKNKGYRTMLASILAKNFRCEALMHGDTVHFLGHKTDAEICVKIFNYAYEVSNRQGRKLVREARKNGENTHGIFNSYVSGFCYGLKKVLDEQCRALMIIVPDDVIEEKNKRATGRYRGGKRNSSIDFGAYQRGIRDGESHMRRKQIEA